jgi:hypothetical protein
VVTEALLVIQARRCPNTGSQDLVSLQKLGVGAGELMGCFIGGFMTQYFPPNASFILYSVFGLILSINACFLTNQSEEDLIEENILVADEPARSSFLSDIYVALGHREINYLVLFLFMRGFFFLHFGDFMYYFLINELKISL